VPRRLNVIEVTGALDPVLTDFIGDSLDKAARQQALAVVIQLNSTHTVVSQHELDRLAFRLSHATVPVTVWVGPSGARAYEGATTLVRAADVSGIAQGARIGNAADPVFGPNPLASRTLGAAQAKSAGYVDVVAPTLGDFIVGLNGQKVGDSTLNTAERVPGSSGPRLRPTVVVSFAKPSLVPRLLHTVASPSVAFLLLVIGLLLMVFEFFTAGIGIAAACGAGAFVLSAYGMAVLPTRPIGVALVVFGMFGYSIDVQTGTPRVWTVIGAVCLALGGLNFYSGLSVGLLPWLLAVVGAALFMIGAMAGVVRARFSTPTIGRESMIGELGTAIGAVNPQGTVRVRGALWRARTNRATPIPGGDQVRVAAIDGLLLEVEPLEGAAKDAGH
jgi:membrane-bound serine protease (ClpP class)